MKRTIEKAREILNQIEQLDEEIVRMFGGVPAGAQNIAVEQISVKADQNGAYAVSTPKRRQMSAAGRARIAAAAKARWARFRQQKMKPKK